MDDIFVEVAITTYTKVLDKTFTYKVPSSLSESVYIGSKLIVPFGGGNKHHEGFVIKLKNQSEFEKTKDIIDVLGEDEVLTNNQLNLVSFLRRRYLSTYSEALNLVTPPKNKIKFEVYYKVSKDIDLNNIILTDTNREIVDFISTNLIKEENLFNCFGTNIKSKIQTLIKQNYIKKIYKPISLIKPKTDLLITKNRDSTLEKVLSRLGKRSPKKIEILKIVYLNEEILLTDLKKEINATKKEIVTLSKSGFIDLKEVDISVNPKLFVSNNKQFKAELNEEQQLVYNSIKKDIDFEKFSPHLIRGVTGSGKTEVYIELVKRVVEKGKSAFIMVPEISLTPQLVSRFNYHFGDEIAIFHSKLTPIERFSQWNDVKKGMKKIVIGARSAIFAPLNNIGIIILDEEHDMSYKSGSSLKYHTKDVALYLGIKENCPVVFGSATPSIESEYNASTGIFKLHTISSRHGEAMMPKVKIIDMREELISGNRSVFSYELKKSINDRLNKNEQVIIMLNRKGHSTYVSCRECGFVLKCPNCEISLTYYKGINKAKCSYCDYEVSVSNNCPSCGSKYYKYMGMGTEKLEELIKSEFVNAKTIRLDSTTTSRKGSLEKIISKVEKKEVDILVGTQIVSKGLDFENVTLVGIVNADSGLNFPDFTANENTFQLLSQVSGRSGRGKKKGQVIIQSYDPENFVIKMVKDHNYLGFYKEELSIRNAFNYPPYFKICSILFNGENENEVIYISENIKKQIEEGIIKNKLKFIEINGPYPAVYSKIKKKYRYQITIKYKKESMKVLRTVLRRVQNNYNLKIRSKYDNINFIIDIDAKSLI